MPALLDKVNAQSNVDSTPRRERTKLSLRSSQTSRSLVAAGSESGVGAAHASGGRAASAAVGAQNSGVPLKQLTAGRKEMKISHAGATYLLRITKSNKLILTKSAST